MSKVIINDVDVEDTIEELEDIQLDVLDSLHEIANFYNACKDANIEVDGIIEIVISEAIRLFNSEIEKSSELKSIANEVLNFFNM